MRVSISVCLLLLSPVVARGQDAGPVPGPLSLAQVLELAETRSESIAIAREGVRRADGEAVRARSGRLPQLTAGLAYERALATEFAGVFDDIGSGGTPPADGGGDAGGDAGAGDGGFDNLPFGRANTWRFSLSLSQNLYSGGRVPAQQAVAAATRLTADVGVTTSRAQLLYDVTQAYYNAALSARLVAIAEATLGQATATLQQTEAAFRAGTQPEFEVLRARVSRDTQNPNLIRQRMNREVALLRLKQLLDLPAESDLQLADQLADEALAPPPPFAERVAPVETAVIASVRTAAAPAAPVAAAERAAVREVAATVSLREAALDLVRAQRRPNVAFTSNYGRNAYPSGFLPAFDRTNWTLGVNMQVPILTGGRQRGDELVAQAELEQTRVRQRQVEELAALDTRSALAELAAARAAWEATAGTVQQASRAYELAGIRYQAGVSTQLELSDSRLLLQQAEANRAVAARDLQVARARVALLPDLPLALAAAGATATSAVPQTTAPGTPAAAATTTQRAAASQTGTQQFGGGQ